MNAETAKVNRTAHQITLQGRASMEVRGVTDVIRFDEQNVLLNTVCGNLAVEGEGLHIHVLSMEQGIVTMDGRIDAISYYEVASDSENARGGFFSKLFR